MVADLENLSLTDEAILDLYERGVTLLQRALAGVSEADLDLVRPPGNWSIRQTFAHLLDNEVALQLRLRFALSEPGRTYNGNAYSGGTWAEGLAHTQRPAFAEVALLGLLQSHAAGLCRLLPGAMDRYLLVDAKESVVRDGRK